MIECLFAKSLLVFPQSGPACDTCGVVVRGAGATPTTKENGHTTGGKGGKKNSRHNSFTLGETRQKEANQPLCLFSAHFMDNQSTTPLLLFFLLLLPLLSSVLLSVCPPPTPPCCRHAFYSLEDVAAKEVWCQGSMSPRQPSTQCGAQVRPPSG